MSRKTKYIDEKKLSFDERQKLVKEYKQALEDYRKRMFESASNKEPNFDEQPPEAPFPWLERH